MTVLGKTTLIAAVAALSIGSERFFDISDKAIDMYMGTKSFIGERASRVSSPMRVGTFDKEGCFEGNMLYVNGKPVARVTLSGDVRAGEEPYLGYTKAPGGPCKMSFGPYRPL